MQNLLDTTLCGHDLMAELHGVSRRVRGLSVADPDYEVLLQQMEVVQSKLGRLPIIDEAHLQLQLEEIVDLKPVLRGKYFGRAGKAKLGSSMLATSETSKVVLSTSLPSAGTKAVSGPS